MISLADRLNRLRRETPPDRFPIPTWVGEWVVLIQPFRDVLRVEWAVLDDPWGNCRIAVLNDLWFVQLAPLPVPLRPEPRFPLLASRVPRDDLSQVWATVAAWMEGPILEHARTFPADDGPWEVRRRLVEDRAEALRAMRVLRTT